MLNLESIQKQVLQSDKIRILGGKSQVKTPETEDSAYLLNMSQYSGVVEYYPEELVITVKAGTLIKQLNKILSEKKQSTSFLLASNENSTIGGAYAMGNSDLRDAVLGIKIIDGQGRVLSFGGQVMKNVAGYDVARLLAGSKGKMAIICEISFKVIPINYVKKTIREINSNIKNNSKIKLQFENNIKNIFDQILN